MKKLVIQLFRFVSFRSTGVFLSVFEKDFTAADHVHHYNHHHQKKRKEKREKRKDQMKEEEKREKT